MKSFNSYPDKRRYAGGLYKTQYCIYCSKLFCRDAYVAGSLQLIISPPQKQCSSCVLSKKCSQKIEEIYRRTSMQSNFIEITHRHGCSPVNFLHVFRTPCPKNTYGGLLLSPKLWFGYSISKFIEEKKKSTCEDRILSIQKQSL